MICLICLPAIMPCRHSLIGLNTKIITGLSWIPLKFSSEIVLHQIAPQNGLSLALGLRTTSYQIWTSSVVPAWWTLRNNVWCCNFDLISFRHSWSPLCKICTVFVSCHPTSLSLSLSCILNVVVLLLLIVLVTLTTFPNNIYTIRYSLYPIYRLAGSARAPDDGVYLPPDFEHLHLPLHPLA